MEQILEKSYEYYITLYHLFEYFKQAFDSVHKKYMLCVLKIICIIKYLVRLFFLTQKCIRVIGNIQEN